MQLRTFFALSFSFYLTLHICPAQAYKPGIMFFKGDCRMKFDHDFESCDGNVLMVEYDGMKASFAFSNGHKIYTLYGKYNRQPNLENFFQSVDALKIYENSKPIGEDNNIEGECHMILNAEATKFYTIKCDIYNRQKEVAFKFYLDHITSFDRMTY